MGVTGLQGALKDFLKKGKGQTGENNEKRIS